MKAQSFCSPHSITYLVVTGTRVVVLTVVVHLGSLDPGVHWNFVVGSGGKYVGGCVVTLPGVVVFTGWGVVCFVVGLGLVGVGKGTLYIILVS